MAAPDRKSIELGRKLRLSVQVPCPPDESFNAYLGNPLLYCLNVWTLRRRSDTTFSAGSLHIGKTGVYRDRSDQPGLNRIHNNSLIKDLDELKFTGTLGRGSTSVVHSAIHKSSGLALAVKEINVFDKDQRRSLLKELRMLYDANSEYLVNFYGAFYSQGSIYIVLELMQLGSLSDLLLTVSAQSMTVPESVLASLAQQVLLAFRYLHSTKHMVHRDIKPSNIVLNEYGRAKLTDFGATTELNENAVATTFVGTSTYMSALGKYPYPNTGVYIELMQSIVIGDVPELPSSHCSELLRSFLNLCLRKVPEDRATTDQLLSHPFITAVTPSSTDLASRWIVDRFRHRG